MAEKESAKDLRDWLNQAHETMQVQLVGLQRLKRERNLAEALLERTFKVLLPTIGESENAELLSVYGALEDHMKLIQERRRG